MHEQALVASDGVVIDAIHYPGLPSAKEGLVFVVVHGFTIQQRQPRLLRVVDHLRAFGAVVTIDMRGHGRSEGRTTVGHFEVLDVEAAVRWARELGYQFIATVGFSLGGAVVLREAALVPGARPDAVVAVSAPAFWFYRGTRIMRTAHRLVETRHGRVILRGIRRTRVSSDGWPDPAPIPPHQAAARLGNVPLLVVHGDVDRYFPLEHPRAIVQSATQAGVDVEFWLEPGFGHAEREAPAELLDRLGSWVRDVSHRQVPAPAERAAS